MIEQESLNAQKLSSDHNQEGPQNGQAGRSLFDEIDKKLALKGLRVLIHR